MVACKKVLGQIKKCGQKMVETSIFLRLVLNLGKICLYFKPDIKGISMRLNKITIALCTLPLCFLSVSAFASYDNTSDNTLFFSADHDLNHSYAFNQVRYDDDDNGFNVSFGSDDDDNGFNIRFGSDDDGDRYDDDDDDRYDDNDHDDDDDRYDDNGDDD